MFNGEDLYFYYQAKQIKDCVLWRKAEKAEFILEGSCFKNWIYIPERQVPQGIRRQADKFFNARYNSDLTNLFK